MIGVPIARVLGVEIRVQLGWVVVVALIAAIGVARIQAVTPEVGEATRWVLALIVALGFFVSAVIHDLAHAIVARRHGIQARAIVVSFFGGATPLDPAAPEPRADLWIAASGPLASIALGLALGAGSVGVSTIGSGAPEVAAIVLLVLAALNLLLGVANLIPAYPLDGGRIVRDIAWRRSGNERAGWLAAARSGRITGLAAAAAGFAIMLFGDVTNGMMVALTGWFLNLAARAISERVRIEGLIGGLRVGDVMEKDPPTVQPGLTVDTFAAQLLDRETPVTAVVVVRDDAFVGLVGVRQVRGLRQDRWPETRVEDVMVPAASVPTLTPADSLLGAAERVQRAGLDGLPVMADERLVGVLTLRSLGVAIQERDAGEKGGRRLRDRWRR